MDTSDFIYKDNYARSKKDYELEGGLVDEAGNRIVGSFEINAVSNGRFHTDWLNMMYPRLKLARDLLREDGVIFISIDDNEVSNLRKLCDEIFGASNFVTQFPWRKRTAKSDVPFGVSQDFEWIVTVAKSSSFIASIKAGKRKYYETPDFPNRPWRIHDLTTQRTASERPNSFFTIVNPKNGEQYPANSNRTWAITVDTFDDYYKKGRIVFPGDYDFLKITKPALRYWKEQDLKKKGDSIDYIAVSTKLPDDVGMSQDGTKEISSLFSGKVFSYAKPSSLIKFLINIINSKDGIVLDFFSGSATTAQAVIKLNSEDGGSRKFIMVQLPDATNEASEAYKAGFKNICEIGKERIRRSGKKIKEETSLEVSALDIGFRVLKLDSSNMEEVYCTPDNLNPELLEMVIDNIKRDRTAEDLLFQTMLSLGIELSEKIVKIDVGGKSTYSVAGGYLLACFDENVDEKTIEEMAKLHPDHLVIRDASASCDNVLDNFEQIINSYSTEKKINTHVL